MPNATRGRQTRAGFTLVELMVVVVLMGIFAAMAAPRFGRAIEQSKADVAMANLKAIWAAERYYWIANRSYTPQLSVLQGLDLIDSNLIDANAVPNASALALTRGYPYIYSISTDGASTLVVTAKRVNSGVWSGQFQIDQTGLYVPGTSDTLTNGTYVISPPQWETGPSGN